MGSTEEGVREIWRELQKKRMGMMGGGEEVKWEDRVKGIKRREMLIEDKKTFKGKVTIGVRKKEPKKRILKK